MYSFIHQFSNLYIYYLFVICISINLFIFSFICLFIYLSIYFLFAFRRIIAQQRPYCIQLRKETFVKLKDLLEFFRCQKESLESMKGEEERYVKTTLFEKVINSKYVFD